MNTLYKMTFLFSAVLETIVLLFVEAVWMKIFAVIALGIMMVTIREDMRRR